MHDLQIIWLSQNTPFGRFCDRIRTRYLLFLRFSDQHDRRNATHESIEIFLSGALTTKYVYILVILLRAVVSNKQRFSRPGCMQAHGGPATCPQHFDAQPNISKQLHETVASTGWYLSFNRSNHGERRKSYSQGWKEEHRRKADKLLIHHVLM